MPVLHLQSYPLAPEKIRELTLFSNSKKVQALARHRWEKNPMLRFAVIAGLAACSWAAIAIAVVATMSLLH